MKAKARDQLIDELIAKDQILEILYRFSRGCDRADEEQLGAVYHPDAIDDHGSFVGPAKEFAAWATKMHLTDCVATSHLIINPIIKFDGDNATGESQVLVNLRIKKDNKVFDLLALGRYLDKFEKREGGWKIADRITTCEWQRIDEVTATNETPLTAKVYKGVRNRDDLSYKYV